MTFLSKTTTALMAGLILSSTAFAYQPNEQRQQSFESREIPSQANHKQQKQGAMQQPRQQNQGNAQPSRQQYNQGHAQQPRQQQNQGMAQQPRQQQNKMSNNQHNWQVGNTLPKSYRDQSYRVNNYQQHDLPKPAKNQRWVYVDGQYILVNILTNAIVQILLGH